MAYIDFNAHRFSMSKGSRRPRKPSKPKEPWKKPQWLIHWRRTLLIILGVIGLLAALYYGYRQLKKYQVRRLDRQALAYLRAGKVKEARMSLLGALRLNPVDPVALHLQVRVQEATGENVQALASYERLARSGKLSLTDLRPYALLAARQGQNDQADRLATIAGKKYPVLGETRGQCAYSCIFSPGIGQMGIRCRRDFSQKAHGRSAGLPKKRTGPHHFAPAPCRHRRRC